MQLGREVLEIAAAALKPGITTDEIDQIVHDAAVERECYPSPLNYVSGLFSLVFDANKHDRRIFRNHIARQSAIKIKR